MIDLDDLLFELFDLDWATKDRLDRELRAIVADYRSALVEDYAKKLAADPPIFRKETPPIPEELGWFYFLGDVRRDIYTRTVRAVRSEAERIMREHRIYQTYNADMWHRWLSKRTAFWAKQHARSTPIYIAELMRALLAERYGVPFAQHYEDEAVAFFVSDGASLGGQWQVLRDAVVRGRRPEDPDYLRVIYAYHPERRLLLRLHHTRIHLPWGRQAVRWIIAQVWWDVWRTQAENIAAAP